MGSVEDFLREQGALLGGNDLANRDALPCRSFHWGMVTARRGAIQGRTRRVASGGIGIGCL